ncbi:uncharacterized protein [Centroberyx affinis]|uniref:uncharacterized protein isoform X1 n=1 Tax=Centroberyx affinis TaxID=166261 RepID=UPI003A5C4D31
MTPLKFAFYLTCVFLGRMVHMTTLKESSSVRQESGLVSVNVGDTVTLRCYREGDFSPKFHWYKQTLGQRPRLMSTFYMYDKNGSFHDEFKDNPRFILDTGNGKNHLTITDLRLSDSATYFCASSYPFKFEFAEGAILSVKGSGSNIQAFIHQLASATIQLGGSVTLNCTVHTGTCDGEHSVYWFRSSGESRPAIIYTHGVRNDQCERKLKTQTQTCVYNFPMKSLNLSDAGTYYCAVVSCGEILFGNGTKMDIEHGVDSVVLVYLLSVAVAFTTILVVILAFSVYKMKKRNCCQCTDSQPRNSVASTPNAEAQDADNLHYAALSENKSNRSRRQRDNTKTECVYSSIRQ